MDKVLIALIIIHIKIWSTVYESTQEQKYKEMKVIKYFIYFS